MLTDRKLGSHLRLFQRYLDLGVLVGNYSVTQSKKTPGYNVTLR
jgi:hypothetical protein